MKTAVCFKIIPDYARLSENDWNWDERYFIDAGFVRNMFNCFDESALEIALKLSQSFKDSGSSCELTALTVDDPKSDLFSRHLMAIGYDHAVRIQCRADIDLRFNPLAVSGLIASHIMKEGYKMVLSGMQGGDGDNWQTGLLIAEHLGWPCIREVTGVEKTGIPDCIKVTSRTDNALRVQTVQLPLVLTVGQSQESPRLRFPTLKQKLSALKKPVTVVSNHELGMRDDRLIQNDKRLTGLAQPPESLPCMFISGRNPGDLARKLYDQFLKDRITL